MKGIVTPKNGKFEEIQSSKVGLEEELIIRGWFNYPSIGAWVAGSGSLKWVVGYVSCQMTEE